MLSRPGTAVMQLTRPVAGEDTGGGGGGMGGGGGGKVGGGGAMRF